MSREDSDDSARLEARREAAVRIERGIEHYAAAQYEAALAELTAALALVPDHPRAMEYASWVREVSSGRRTLQSGGYAAVYEDELVAMESSVPAPAPSLAPPIQSGRTRPGMPKVSQSSGSIRRTQLDEAPDSVTREWSSIVTGHNLPQLDVPELSEEQIANLLEHDGGRGITLSAGRVPAVVAPVVPEPDEPDEEEDEEHERTNVRLGEQTPVVPLQLDDEEDGPERIIELVAEAEDQTPEPGRAPRGMGAVLPSEPALTPLTSSGTAIPAQRGPDQTSDDAPSMPTNPFVRQRLSELAGSLFATPETNVEDLPVPPRAQAAIGPAAIEAALQRGAAREALDAAERLVEARGGLDAPALAGELALVLRAYEVYVGDLSMVPRHGKATPELDSRSAFLLSRIDGATSADDLLDVSGMPRADALRVLARLIASGVVTMRK